VRAALAVLSEADREVLVLRYLEELPAREVGAVLARPTLGSIRVLRALFSRFFSFRAFISVRLAVQRAIQSMEPAGHHPAVSVSAMKKRIKDPKLSMYGPG
jgi:hypothetical protein